MADQVRTRAPDARASFDVSGKVFAITGAAKGIGANVAEVSESALGCFSIAP
jgi:hypothetical protein